MDSTNNKSSLLSPIGGESVVQQVINRITDALISGELKPGDQLPTEMQMISAFHVSRNSLRSALQTLRSMGVLEVRRPEGTFVCEEFSLKMLDPMIYRMILSKQSDYQDLVGLRKIIDTGISQFVIEKGLSEEEVEELETLYAEMVALLTAEKYDVDAISAADARFHEAVARATNNSLAVMLNDFLLNITSESRRRVIAKCGEENNAQYLIDTHRQHLDALEQKTGSDLDKALDFSYFYWKDSFKS